MKHLYILLFLLTLPPLLFGQKIIDAEYFIGNDPGVGKGTAITITQGNSISQNFTLSTAQLSVGYHNLYVRVKDSLNRWSIAQKRRVYVVDTASAITHQSGQIQKAEYFVNSDPGVGNGIPINVTSGTTVSQNFNFTIDTSLTVGYHQVYVRVMDSSGAWSSAKAKRIYVMDTTKLSIPQHSDIVKAEYYFDADPGQGKGIPLPITGGSYVKHWDKVDVTGLSMDVHTFNIRVQNKDSIWSIARKDTFRILNCVMAETRFVHDNVCAGETVYFTDKSKNVASTATYAWDFDFDGNTDSITKGNVQYFYPTPGVYTVSLVINHKNKCIDSFVNTVVVSNPKVFIGNDTTLFGGTSIDLDAGPGFYNYVWNDGSITQKITVDKTGTYAVTVRDSIGCEAHDSIEINYKTLFIDITVQNSSCGDSNGIASVKVTGGSPPYKLFWSTGDTASQISDLPSGIYVVTVEDSKGLKDFGVATINDKSAPTITVDKVTNLKCFNNEDGKIDISVSGGKAPYNFVWSNGQTTEDATKLKPGPYEVIVIDDNNCKTIKKIDVDGPPELKLVVLSQDATCGNSNGKAVAKAYGGTGSYAYFWSAGGSGETKIGQAAGIYSVSVKDQNNCVTTTPYTVNEEGAPKVKIDSIIDANCQDFGGAVYISVVGGSGHYKYNWSGGITSKNLVNVSAAPYDLTVTDSVSGCRSFLRAFVRPQKPVTPEICMVTVDTVTNSNLIVWERQRGFGIASYNIYKESTKSGVYFKIGSRPFDSLSTFVDPVSDPRIRSYRYKITSVDSCGTESKFSEIHKTVHLNINVGISNTMNLIWDHYEGFSFGTYYIYRWSPATGWEILDSIPSNLNSYTDLTPPKGMFYQVGARRDKICAPLKVRAQTTSGPFSHSLSNIKDYGIQREDNPPGFPEIEKVITNINVFPNPYKEQTNITYEVLQKSAVKIGLYNSIGQEITIINQNNGNPGFYQIQLNSNELNLQKGIYYLIFDINGQKLSRKIIKL